MDTIHNHPSVHITSYDMQFTHTNHYALNFCNLLLNMHRMHPTVDLSGLPPEAQILFQRKTKPLNSDHHLAFHTGRTTTACPISLHPPQGPVSQRPLWMPDHLPYITIIHTSFSPFTPKLHSFPTLNTITLHHNHHPNLKPFFYQHPSSNSPPETHTLHTIPNHVTH